MTSLVEARSFEAHRGEVTTVAVTPDERAIVSGGEDGAIRIWDLDDCHELATLTGHTGAVMAVAASVDGRRIISGGYDRTLRVWEIKSGELLYVFEGPSSFWCVATHGNRIYAGDVSGDVRALEMQDLTPGPSIVTAHRPFKRMSVTCLDCGARQIVAESELGLEIKCVCGQRLRINRPTVIEHSGFWTRLLVWLEEALSV